MPIFSPRFAGWLTLAVSLATTFGVCFSPDGARAATLVENGRAAGVIVVAPDAAPQETQAAQELQRYIREISGATLPIVAEAGNNRAIRLGKIAETPQLLASLRAKGNDAASFVLQSDDKGTRIVGLSPQGTLFGTYELLEQMGVRWFMPGPLGTVVPRSPTLRLSTQTLFQVPSFAARWHNGNLFPEWASHLRMGGPHFPSAHGIPGIKPSDFAEHPEYFALVDGKRTTRQLNISNPDVLRLAIAATRDYFRKNPDEPWIGMGPNDGSGFCECENCRALDGGDFDPLSNEPAMTDRYVWFFNRVLAGIADEFPDKKIGFYAYHTYMRPPVKTQPNPRIVPAFAPITLCRVHGMENPLCPERSYARTIIEAWGKIIPETYDRGYWFNLADPGFPFSEVHRVRVDIPLEHRLGIKGWRVETLNHWGSETPTLYIAAKLMWNHKADVSALLSDFYDKFFGPARQPMRDYFETMDAALRDADHHTGGSFDMPHFYTPAVRQRARAALQRAARLGGSGVYRQRVQMFQSTFDYLNAFIAMQNAMTRGDFAAAQRQLANLDARQKQLVAFDPPLIHPKLGAAYLARFFRQPVEQASARAQTARGLVVPMGDEWQFQIDPRKVGEDLGWWREYSRGGNWQTLKTASRSWSDQGLRYYKGEAWYRQDVTIPATFRGQRAFLWFGGVDEKAKVWVNGQPVGISHGAAFLPFEFDATAAIKPGARNVVVVRVLNERVDELGTGGLTAPAMFYRPANGAKPDNVRELSPTFP